MRPPGEAGAYGGDGSRSTTPPRASLGGDDVSLTLWGVPAAHDPRPAAPVKEPGEVAGGHFGAASGAVEAPYFTNPTACASKPLQAQVHGDLLAATRTKAKARRRRRCRSARSRAVIALGMEPSLTAEATSDSAYARPGSTSYERSRRPTGTRRPGDLDFEEETVTLPEGMTINPSSGAGLPACSEAQYAEERLRKNRVGKERGPRLPKQLEAGDASRSRRRSLEEEVTGSVFLATPRAARGRGPEPVQQRCSRCI